MKDKELQICCQKFANLIINFGVIATTRATKRFLFRWYILFAGDVITTAVTCDQHNIIHFSLP